LTRSNNATDNQNKFNRLILFDQSTYLLRMSYEIESGEALETEEHWVR